jgi:DNA-binding SARP family transcriptional activator
MAANHGLAWLEARAALLGAAARGDDDLLAVALDLTGRRGFEVLWSTRARQHAGPLLARAVAAGLGAPGQASALAVACGGEVLDLAEAAVGDAPARSSLDEARTRSGRGPRPPVRIATLGGFSVWRGGVPVPDLTTGRQKARTLLAILVSADGATHREVLLEHLWPDLPPERGLAALHSALYTLRKALEPEATRQSPPTLVVTDGEAYRLDLANRDEWDAATFSRLATRAAEPTGLELRLERLLAAEAAWGGPYLPEWPYEDWATARRNELGRQREGLLAAAAEALFEAGQARAALARWQQLVDLDPECEAWHRSLMRAYAAAGERALALRQYQACRAVLRERLGVDPSPETTSLYRELL